MLMKPHDEIIGAFGLYFDLAFELKFNEPSVATFMYPAEVDGTATPLYDQLVKDKQIQIDPLAVFVVVSATETNDGVRKMKEVTLKTREVELAGKKLILEAGTYNLWNPADKENTILGMVEQAAPSWKIGHVSPTLIGRYRTFDETDANALDWMHSSAQDSYGCLFVYDTWNRTINVYDAAEDPEIVPVYLSYQNLIEEGSISGLEDTFPTKLYVKGADGVDIRDVNPTGDNFIYNLDYYISNGDISGELAKKWVTWQNAIFAQQPYYTSLVALRNSATARQVSENAQLVELRNQLATLDNARTTFLQMQQKYGAGSDSWDYFAERLSEAAIERAEIETSITEKETLLQTIQAEINDHNAEIALVNAQLKMGSFFSVEDLAILDKYLRQDTFEDTTFAVFDVDITNSGSLVPGEAATLRFENVTWVDIECAGGHRMAAISGGKLTLTDTDYDLSADIVSATLDHHEGEVICSLFLNAGTVNEESFAGGNLTCIFKSDYDDVELLNTMTKHEEVQTSDDGSVSRVSVSYTGSPALSGAGGSFYFTRNVTEYQRYSVQQSLYDYAVECHKDIASPEYEFDISSGNFLADERFEMFKDKVQLGCACYLQLTDDHCLTPVLTEIHFSLEDPTEFDLIFSNRFRRPDDVAKLKETLQHVTTSSRTFDSRKYAYGANNNATTWVQQLFVDGYEAALAQIKAGQNKTVTIDEAGIRIDSTDGTDSIHLNDGMIALVDKSNDTVKMAMGHFLNPATGTDYVGILADIIGGTLLAGQNLIIECPDPNGGVMQFKVDSSGVILNNGRLYMRTDKGAMGWDANHGFFAGNKDLFTTTDTGYVRPSCLNENGDLILDDDGFPHDVNVWIGIDGKSYFRGNIYAEDGIFNGTVYATAGKFDGVVQASQYLDASGTDMMENGKWKSDYLDLMGINVKNDAGDTVLTIDQNGIRFDSRYSPIKYQYSVNGTSNWHDTMTSSDLYRRESFDGGETWGSAYQFKGQNGQNGTSANVTQDNIIRALSEARGATATFITADSAGSPNIYGGNIYGTNIYAGDGNDVYAKMDGYSFGLYRDGVSNARALIEASDSQVRLILGVGSETNSSVAGRFFVQKGEDIAGIYLNSETMGADYGFTIEADGTVTAHAEKLNGFYLTFA